MVKFKSFKVAVFLLITTSILIPLIILSFVLANSLNSKIDGTLEENIAERVARSELIYGERKSEMLDTGHSLSRDTLFFETLRRGDTGVSKSILKFTSELKHLDLASLVKPSGEVITGIGIDDRNLSFLGGLLEKALESGIPVVAFEIVPEDSLQGDLAFQSEIRKIPTLYSGKDYSQDVYERRGLMIVSVIPVSLDEETVGIVLGDLLNRDYRLPDRIRMETGLHATLFLEDTRVSTTVETSEGERFIGTSLSQNVREKTLFNKEPFAGRTWAVNDWGRAVYLPLKNHDGEVVGVFGAGLFEDDFLESQFFFRKEDFIYLFAVITGAVALLSLIIAYLITRKITKPIYNLIDSTIEIGEGNFEDEVKIDSYEEMNRLAASFNHMIRALRKQMVDKEREIAGEYAKKLREEDDET